VLEGVIKDVCSALYPEMIDETGNQTPSPVDSIGDKVRDMVEGFRDLRRLRAQL
jgi:hypothetical protein